MRRLHVAIGVDCDPDRASYPQRLTWRGIEHVLRLFEIPDVRWTFNVRADTQIRDYCGSAAYCVERFDHVWRTARAEGSAIAWHLHYFDRQGRQDTSEQNVRENIRAGAEALGHPDVVHMGWTYQDAFSIRTLYEAGVRVDYSPLPRMQFGGRRRTDAYDWHGVPNRPFIWHDVQMIPAFTARDPLLGRRFGTERVMLTTSTHPLLYRRLLRQMLESGTDYFVSYFHADELVPALGGWRDRLYAFRHLRANLAALRDGAAQLGYEIAFVTVRDLAHMLFSDRATAAPIAQRATVRATAGVPHQASVRVTLVTHDSAFGRYVAATVHRLCGLDRVIVETGRPSWRFYARKLRRIGPLNAVVQLWFDRRFRRAGARHLPALSMPPHETVRSINGLRFGDDELVIGFGTSIVAARTLASAPRGILNLHTGWLPRYRGVKSEWWTLARGDVAHAGWTLHYMTPRLDDGDIVLRQRVEVDGVEPAVLRARLLIDAAPALARFIERVRHDGFASITRCAQTDGQYYAAPTWRDLVRYRRRVIAPGNAA